MDTEFEVALIEYETSPELRESLASEIDSAPWGTSIRNLRRVLAHAQRRGLKNRAELHKRTEDRQVHRLPASTLKTDKPMTSGGGEAVAAAMRPLSIAPASKQAAQERHLRALGGSWEYWGHLGWESGCSSSGAYLPKGATAFGRETFDESDRQWIRLRITQTTTGRLSVTAGGK